jgi:hypothetical protein
MANKHMTRHLAPMTTRETQSKTPFQHTRLAKTERLGDARY